MTKWIVLGVWAIIVVMAITVTITNFNRFVGSENFINARHKDLQNVHGMVYQKMEAASQPAKQYRELLITSIEKTMTGKYGEDGIKAALLMIKEDQPKIEASVFKELTDIITSSYQALQVAQTDKIDAIRVYKDQYQMIPGNIVAYLFGFPRINITEMEKLIVHSTTSKTFETGVMESPKLDGK